MLLILKWNPRSPGQAWFRCANSKPVLSAPQPSGQQFRPSCCSWQNLGVTVDMPSLSLSHIHIQLLPEPGPVFGSSLSHPPPLPRLPSCRQEWFVSTWLADSQTQQEPLMGSCTRSGISQKLLPSGHYFKSNTNKQLFLLKGSYSILQLITRRDVVLERLTSYKHKRRRASLAGWEATKASTAPSASVSHSRSRGWGYNRCNQCSGDRVAERQMSGDRGLAGQPIEAIWASGSERDAVSKKIGGEQLRKTPGLDLCLHRQTHMHIYVHNTHKQ